jgi:hypothetical protein
VSGCRYHQTLIFHRRRKNKSAIGGLAFSPLHLQLRVFQIDDAVVAILHGYISKGAIHVELPGMIGTSESMFIARVARMIITNQRAVMRAAVIKYMDVAARVFAEDHAFFADPRRPIIAGVRHLAFMANINPGLVEYVL